MSTIIESLNKKYNKKYSVKEAEEGGGHLVYEDDVIVGTFWGENSKSKARALKKELKHGRRKKALPNGEAA